MTTNAAAPLLAAATLLLAGCGGDDDARAAKAIADSLSKPQASAASGPVPTALNKKDAGCVGDGLVEEIGTEKLQTYGLLTADLTVKKQVTEVTMSSPDAESATEVLFGCTDVTGEVKRAIKRAGLPPRVRRCVDTMLTEDALRRVVTETWQGRQAQAQRRLLGPLQRCATRGSG